MNLQSHTHISSGFVSKRSKLNSLSRKLQFRVVERGGIKLINYSLLYSKRQIQILSMLLMPTHFISSYMEFVQYSPFISSFSGLCSLEDVKLMLTRSERMSASGRRNLGISTLLQQNLSRLEDEIKKKINLMQNEGKKCISFINIIQSESASKCKGGKEQNKFY